MSLIKQGPWRPAILALGGLVLLVVAWQLGVMLLKLNMPIVGRFAPLPTLNSLIYLIGDAGIYGHIWASLQRVLVGLGLALLIGVPVGLLLGRSALAEQLSGGAFQLLRMISPLSWMPIAVMVFGVGDAPIYFLLTFAAVWPIILNTSAGVKAIDRNWLQLGASLSATRWETLRSIIFPAVLGHILTGLRLAIGVVWIVLVPCEMLGVNEGLGYFILDTRDRLAYSELMAAVVLIGLIGWGLDALARWLHKRWAMA
ncbi:ABC transporter permease [Brachymonas sp. G13]|uniref:ABC transporter permease n=1 Tax=Brachymonas TaxID=28219 RepID=UPI0016BCB5F1|nr:ABC transporter permease [Brachymonas sp. J145]MEE1654542.1 ABC transporter permease [Brachymonas sp. J145]NLX15598.1 ABC transporter permease [Ramlibacter sp.]